jgi:FtsP/CotA-like multicopper oxidase with cupredoxin domain
VIEEVTAMPAAHHTRVRRVLVRAGAAALAALTLGGATIAAAKPAPRDPVARIAAVGPSVTIDLCANPGTVTLPGAGTVPFWGFARKPAATPCSAVVPRLPGPALKVAVNDNVTLNITNTVPGHTLSLDAPGVPLAAGAMDVAPGATVSLTFPAATAGTYLYEATGDGGRQQAMGLYGALVVCSSTPCPTSGPGYDRTSTLVLSEVDPALNADPDGFDMRRWAPTHWLINGQVAPNVDEIPAGAGDRVLLRYVSAGPENVTMTTLGLRSKVVARDAYPLTTPIDVVAETVPSGSTADMIATVPAGAASGTGFPLYNRQLHLTNGQLTFFRVP